MPSTRDDPFESPRALIDGAKEDLIQLKRLIRAYADGAYCVPVFYDDRKTSHRFIKLQIVNAPPPRIRYLASGVLNNLRHTLDQAANVAAVELRAGNRDGYFPFGKDSVGIAKVVEHHCKTFPPELIAYLLTFKPYGGGDDLLYAMSKSAGPNKHQITVNIEAELQGFTAQEFISEFKGPGELGMLGWNNKKRELTFAHPKAADAYVITQINGDTRLPFHIEIGGSAAFEGHEATAMLGTLICKVERIVSGIQAETARLIASRL
jgi:hypothetical protein